MKYRPSKDEMLAEIEQLERAKRENPDSSLVAAIDHRIAELRRKLASVRIS